MPGFGRWRGDTSSTFNSSFTFFETRLYSCFVLASFFRACSMIRMKKKKKKTHSILNFSSLVRGGFFFRFNLRALPTDKNIVTMIEQFLTVRHAKTTSEKTSQASIRRRTSFTASSNPRFPSFATSKEMIDIYHQNTAIVISEYLAQAFAQLSPQVTELLVMVIFRSAQDIGRVSEFRLR